MKREYQIWSEGFLITGMEGVPAKAKLCGTGKGETFQEACDIFFNNRNHKNYAENKKYYNSKYLTYWGCRLFEKESDARKSFG